MTDIERDSKMWRYVEGETWIWKPVAEGLVFTCDVYTKPLPLRGFSTNSIAEVSYLGSSLPPLFPEWSLDKSWRIVSLEAEARE